MSTATPCARCSTLGGIAWRHVCSQQDPRRADGTAYGHPGPLCFVCFQWAKEHPAAAPCDECGTTGGHIPANQRRPRRYSALGFGGEGVICEACYSRHRRDRRNGAWRPIGLPSIEPPETELRPVVIRRVAAVSAAKAAKEAKGLSPILTVVELNAVLPDEPEDSTAPGVASTVTLAHPLIFGIVGAQNAEAADTRLSIGSFVAGTAS
jgi:hypothetical protein